MPFPSAPLISVPPKTNGRYGLSAAACVDERKLELKCFLNSHSIERGGLGKFGHFAMASRLMWPQVRWNPWLVKAIKSLCNEEHTTQLGDVVHRFVSWTGCGAAGKTYAAGFYAVLWWCADPLHSTVILTSTTKEMIGKRIWPVIQHFVANAVDVPSRSKILIGNLIDSRKMLQAAKGDEKDAISAIAVAHGETSKAVENLKGQHNERMLVVIDEANQTPEAIFQTIPNMRKGCRDFTVLSIGNAVSRLDSHGRACEPKNGWPSISVEDDEWVTKGVADWEMESGICLHFDGVRSPNVTGKRTIYPYLYSWENYQRAVAAGRLNSVSFWSQTRGFWAPDGTTNTIFSEVMIDMHGGRGDFVFVSVREGIAFLDPAFGGDACVAQFGVVGDIEPGRKGIQLTDAIEIHPLATSLEPSDKQIARQFSDECKKRGVRPRMAGSDATGIGRGVYAFLVELWSHEVQRVEFGGAASDMPASAVDPRPSKEAYDRRVTELWYTIRTFLEAEQLKGLYHEAIVQLCTREYEDLGKKVKLETKEECKKKLGRSPDHGDAVAGICEIARRNGITAHGLVARSTDRTWEKVSRESSLVHDNAYEEVGVFNTTYEPEPIQGLF